MNLIVCDSDGKSLERSPVSAKILLGTTGLGEVNKPEVAKNMAIERREEIKKIIMPNTKMLFIVAGMGGGIGSGQHLWWQKLPKVLPMIMLKVRYMLEQS